MSTGFFWSGFGGTATQTICLYPYSLQTTRSTHVWTSVTLKHGRLCDTRKKKVSSKMRRPEDITTNIPHERNTHVQQTCEHHRTHPIPSHAAPNNRYPPPHRQIDKNYAGWGGQIDSADIPCSLSLAPQDHWERIEWNPSQQSGKHQTSHSARSLWSPKTIPSNNSPLREALRNGNTLRRFRTGMSCVIYSGWEGGPQKQIPNSAVFILSASYARRRGWRTPAPLDVVCVFASFQVRFWPRGPGF